MRANPLKKIEDQGFYWIRQSSFLHVALGRLQRFSIGYSGKNTDDRLLKTDPCFNTIGATIDWRSVVYQSSGISRQPSVSARSLNIHMKNAAILGVE